MPATNPDLDPFLAQGGGVRLANGGWVDRNNPAAGGAPWAGGTGTGAGGAATGPGGSSTGAGGTTTPGTTTPAAGSPGAGWFQGSDGGWLPPDRAGTVTPLVPPGTGTTAPSYSQINYNTTAAPSFTAPTRAGAAAPLPTRQGATQPLPTYQDPGSFVAPDANAMTLDPGYQFRLAQGEDAAMRARSRAGILRTGNTLADLADYGQGAASQEYGNVFNRSKDVWDRSLQRANALLAGDTTRWNADAGERDATFNAGMSGWNADAGERDATYNAAVTGAQLNYAPTLMTWQADEAAKAKKAELEFDRSWQDTVYNRDDMYRRGRDTSNDAYRDRAYTGDDAYRRLALDQDMEQFLIDQGNY